MTPARKGATAPGAECQVFFRRGNYGIHNEGSGRTDTVMILNNPPSTFCPPIGDVFSVDIETRPGIQPD